MNYESYKALVKVKAWHIYHSYYASDLKIRVTRNIVTGKITINIIIIIDPI